MRAVVRRGFGPPDDVLRLRLVERPEPEDAEVLVRVHAAAIAIGDWLETRGYPYFARPGYGLLKPKHPVAGNELAGRVEAVGEWVESVRPGDEVYGCGNGAFAEFVTAPEATIAPKPERLTFAQAAAVPVSGIAALQALRDAGRLEGGQRVAILGASGGVGTFAVQIAKSFGAGVTGVCGPDSVDLVRSVGADHVVDYTSEDVAELEQAFDLIVDVVGKQPVSEVRRALTPTGTLVMVGTSGGPLTMGFQRTIGGGIRSLFVRQRLRPFFSKVTRGDLSFLKALIDAGELTPVIDREYPLGEIREALRHVSERHTRGKTVIAV
jgi:NADPH:quinone reductase-like Zn-dependent oxidoreductase